MRDNISSPFEFCLQIEKKIKCLISLDDQNLRSDVVNNSNFHFENLTFFNLRNLNLKDAIRLSILSWFIPEEVGIILRMDILGKIKNYSLEDQLLLNQFLKNKGQMLIFLQETNLWHSRDFFGNILDKRNKLDRYFKLSPLRRKCKKPERKRGYHDQGSRVPDHKRLPNFDYSLTDKQNQIEENRQSYLDTLSFLEGLLI